MSKKRRGSPGIGSPRKTGRLPDHQPLSQIETVANAGVSVVDTRNASADGYELTLAVNSLAHAQLIGDLLDSLAELARPAAPDDTASLEQGGIAYSNFELGMFYYAHELQRRAPSGINVVVFEPGSMPGTGLSRAHGPSLQRVGRAIERIPGVSSPTRSGPALASVVLDDRWAHLRDGTFVVKNEERQVKPFASDLAREFRLWDATAELLDSAR